ncbi:MAG: hypothetical protein WCO90_07200 [Planctomycetota bacterium]
MALPIVTATEPNYDEAAVGPYTLPDVLAGPDGQPATTADDWTASSRPHQFALLEQSVCGRSLPEVPVSPVGTVERAEIELARGAKAIRFQARLRLGDAANAPITDVLLYLPV